MIRFSLSALVLGLGGAAVASDMIPVPASGTWPVEEAAAAGYPYDGPYGGHAPGGYERRIGKPYYWSVPGGTMPLPGGAASGTGGAVGYDAGRFDDGVAGSVTPGGRGCGCSRGNGVAGGPAGVVGSAGPASGPLGPVADPAFGASAVAGPAGAGPSGSPDGDPYSYHFGPGFYRSNEFGHYRFPYSSYRRPWYDLGHPARVRDTNLPW